MSYNITIIGNNTKEVLLDQEVKAVIGAVVVDDKLTQGMVCAHCGPLDLARAVQGAEASIKDLRRRKPKLALAEMILSITTDTKEELVRAEKNGVPIEPADEPKTVPLNDLIMEAIMKDMLNPEKEGAPADEPKDTEQ